MKLSEKLRKAAVGKHVGFASLLEAADLLDATTTRPWPPPEGVTRCLAWRKGNELWGACWLDTEPEYWDSCYFKDLTVKPPQFWLPMPPEPEVGP